MTHTHHARHDHEDGFPGLTFAMRSYLQAAWRLASTGEPVTITQLADAQEVAPASTTAMVKKLVSLGLMTHHNYGAVELTPEGEKQALLAIRRHRLLECFLIRMLGYTMDEVHDDSHQLEPAISDRLETKMDAALGHPTRCPHGDPIPGPDGVIRDGDLGFPLSELKEGLRAMILRVPGSRTELLRYLMKLGLVPEKQIRLVKREPFGGPLHLKLGRRTVLLGPEAADHIYVTNPTA